MQLGLLKEKLEWKRELRDNFRSNFVPLSHLFATILAHCEQSETLDIFNEHKIIFISNILKRFIGKGNYLR